MTDGYYTILKDRAGIAVSGRDAFAFLQGLITQDLHLLERQALIYSALLSPNGKIEYDFFIFKHDDAFILECDLSRLEALFKRLSIFRLRKEIELKIVSIQSIAVWGDEDALKAFPYPADPRDAALGIRKISIEPIDIKELNHLKETDFKFYHKLCITRRVPCGARDIAIGEDTAADLDLDRLNGVSYAKGCYMGQELTSRMHHRGLAKRGLYAVSIDGEVLPPFTDIVAEGHLIGEMRSSVDRTGLAVLRHDSLKLAASVGLVPI